ncbi:MAG: hypothetical protein LBB98_05915 [Treponema sp.]|jgi:hypothetical protein|nr:hypothetical protein [Treponema sp.]
MNVTSNRNITAEWKEKTQTPTEQYYTVTFMVDEDASGYEFKGWVGNYTNITGPVTVYADWQKIEQTIPAFNYTDMNVECGYDKTNILTGNVDPVGASATIGNLAYAYFNQSKNLSAGYNAVAGEYDAQNPKFRSLAAAEDAYRITMKTINDAVDYKTTLDTNIDGILDTFFGNSGSARSAFDTEFNAYKLGAYLGQTARDNNANTVRTQFINSLSGTGLTAETNANGMLTNYNSLMTELKSRLLTKTDNAMGVGNISNTTNRTRASELNGYLLNQIGEDVMQFDALVDDFKDIDPNMDTAFYDWQYMSAAEPQKASMWHAG